MISLYRNFWMSHPALFYSIFFLLGFYCYFHPSKLLVIPFTMLIAPFFSMKSWRNVGMLSLSVLMAVTAWSYSGSVFLFPEVPVEGIKGIAYVEVEKAALQHSLFGLRYVYQCRIKQFYSLTLERDQLVAKNLPCRISIPADGARDRFRPESSHVYWVEGRLIRKESGTYHLKVASKSRWIQTEEGAALGGHRERWKQSLANWIHQSFSNSSSADFIVGLATGEFNSPMIRQQFSRFGLQHLLAISGFHFAITACFLNLIFSLFMSMKVKNFALLLSLATYTMFLGPYPSVLRAWIMCSLALLGELIGKTSTPLNSLGFSLMVILLYDPLLSLEVSFKLSFGITAAILLFYPPISTWFNGIITKRKLKEVLSMKLVEQGGYCILSFLRSAISLMAAVNVLAIPLSLYFFGVFPWLSLFYNLFIPFLATGSMCLFLLAFFMFPVPWISSALMQLNEAYSTFLLKMIFHTPEKVDALSLNFQMPEQILLLYLFFIFFFGIWLKQDGTRRASDKKLLWI